MFGFLDFPSESPPPTSTRNPDSDGRNTNMIHGARTESQNTVFKLSTCPEFAISKFVCNVSWLFCFVAAAAAAAAVCMRLGGCGNKTQFFKIYTLHVWNLLFQSFSLLYLYVGIGFFWSAVTFSLGGHILNSVRPLWLML
jgi:hypothetical protein